MRNWLSSDRVRGGRQFGLGCCNPLFGLGKCFIERALVFLMARELGFQLSSLTLKGVEFASGIEKG